MRGSGFTCNAEPDLYTLHTDPSGKRILSLGGLEFSHTDPLEERTIDLVT